MGRASGARGPGGAHSRAAEAELAAQWHSAVRQLTVTAAHQLDPGRWLPSRWLCGWLEPGPMAVRPVASSESRRRSPKRSLRSLRLDSRGA